ncbi:MAG: hypothetical protein ACFE8J_08800 [Candidatus Heimdallarchaeota archaeon]
MSLGDNEKNTLSQDIVKGLILSKYLYKKAVEESKLKGINSKLSILSFHDAVEMFLYMACLHKEKKRKKDNFYEFWNVLELTHKTKMARLNKIRNNLKHSAIEPTDNEVKTISKNVTDFFNKNIKSIFGVEFSEISLTTLIDHFAIKKMMSESENLLEQFNYDKSVDKSAEAFYRILYDSANRICEMLIEKYRQWMLKAPFEEWYEKRLECEAQAINLLPIEKRNYPLFTKIVHRIDHLGSGKLRILKKREPITEEEAQICFDFVLDVILSVQEFD